MRSAIVTLVCGWVVVSLLAPATAWAQPGWILSHQKISDTEGGFTWPLNDHDRFGISAASLGDLDGDAVIDLAVGAHRNCPCCFGERAAARAAHTS